MKPKNVRRSYHHGDLKNELLNTALDEIARHGVRALSLREVARRAGVSHTASYRHFPSKDSLLAAIAEQGFRRLSASMRDAIRPHTDDPLMALQASGIAYVEFGVSCPDHLNVMFSGEIAGEDAAGLVEASKEAYAVFTSIVQQGLQVGALRGPDARTITLAAWSQVHGLAQLMAGGQLEARGVQPTANREIASAVTRLLHEGISVPGARGTGKAAVRTTGKKKSRRSS